MTTSNPSNQGARPTGPGKGLAEFLHRNRTYILFALLAALAVNFGYWGITNFLNLFWASRVGPWVESTLLAAEIGLAIGTLALAAGGLLQSRAAGIQLELASRQERREDEQLRVASALFRPHLDLQVVEAATEPTTQDTFLIGPDRWFILCRLRNLGPGAAVDVQVTAFQWFIETGQLQEEIDNLRKGSSIKGPILSLPFAIPRDIVNVSYSLKPGEDRDFGLPFRIPPPPEKLTGLLQQAVVLAWAKDLEGAEAASKKLGLRLQFALESPVTEHTASSGTRTIWRWLTDEEVARIPGLPQNRVSWRTMTVPKIDATSQG